MGKVKSKVGLRARVHIVGGRGGGGGRLREKATPATNFLSVGSAPSRTIRNRCAPGQWRAGLMTHISTRALHLISGRLRALGAREWGESGRARRVAGRASVSASVGVGRSLSEKKELHRPRVGRGGGAITQPHSHRNRAIDRPIDAYTTHTQPINQPNETACDFKKKNCHN